MAYSKDVLKNMINEFGNLVASGSTNMKTLYLYHSLVTNPSNVHQIIQIPELLQAIANNGSTIGAYLLARHEKYAQSEDLAKYIAESVDAMNHIALNDTLRSFVRKKPIFWNAISQNDMAIAKWIAGEAGLDPTAYSDMTALANDETAMNAVANSETAMNAIANSETALDAVVNSSTASRVIHQTNPKWLPISDWDTAQVAYYPFEGNANDAFGNYNGTWHGNEQYEASPWGQAAKFDEQSNIKLVSRIFDIHNDSFTVTFFVYPCSSELIFSYAGESSGVGRAGYKFTSEYLKYAASTSSDSTVNFSESIPLDTWSCIEIRNDAANNLLSIRKNNQVIASISLSNIYWYDSRYPPKGMFVGGYIDPDGSLIGGFTGLIDNIRIFNRALTDEEVQRIYLYEKNVGGL